MEHVAHDGGPLAGDPSGAAAPGGDPLDAVLAVSRPREEAARDAAPPPPAEAAGVTVETRVRLDGETAAAGEVVAEADGYGEFAWPDGYAADPAAMAKFVPLAKKLGLPREAAQELAGLYAELDQERNRSQAEFIARNNAEWLREIQNHPEFGGQRLARVGEDVAHMMRRYGSPLLLAQIRQMNVQNWPEMFYFLARLSRLAKEDASPSGAGGHAAAKSTAQLLFPGLK